MMMTMLNHLLSYKQRYYPEKLGVRSKDVQYYRPPDIIG